jgi:hypothetical protein
MTAIGLALRLFFRTLFNREFRQQAERLVRGELIDKAAAPSPATVPKAEPKKQPPPRSEALTLLAALQREARLVDFLQEPIADYNDAQIGAAVRDIHRDCAAVLERMFGLRPLLTEAEGAAIEVPAGFDAARYSLTGNVAGQPPFRGTLAHHGWQVTRCELPQFSGGDDAAKVVAPAVVELK